MNKIHNQNQFYLKNIPLNENVNFKDFIYSENWFACGKKALKIMFLCLHLQNVNIETYDI